MENKTNLPDPIQQSIESVNRYFIEQIKSGNYTIDNASEFTQRTTIDITISGCKFCLWIANSPFNFECYSGSYNFMALSFSENEKEVFYKLFNDDFSEYHKRPDVLNYRRSQYLKLKEEFEPKTT